MIRRREFIAGLGAVVWPLAARAQQVAMPVIGYLNGGSASTSMSLGPFLQGLKESAGLGG